MTNPLKGFEDDIQRMLQQLDVVVQHARNLAGDGIPPLPSDRELVQRAINQASSQYQGGVLAGELPPVPRWVIVKRLFCYGSSTSKRICEKYGYAPDKMIDLDCIDWQGSHNNECD